MERGAAVPKIGERAERRRECRLPVSVDGTLKARDGRWTHYGIVEDLHRFGVRARLPDADALSEGEAVFVEFALASAPDAVPGQVRWAQRCEEGGLRCGIRFDDVLSLQLPLETVTAACATLQNQMSLRGRQAFLSFLEKAVLAMHGETWAGGLFALSAEPAQQVLNTLAVRLELESLRLQKALAAYHTASLEDPLHTVMARTSDLFRELQAASGKIKEGIACLRLVQADLVLEPESYLYTVDPAKIIRRAVSSMETLCAFLGGKMGALRFQLDADGLPLLAIRPVDFRCAVNACLLGLMESALLTDGTTLTVSSLTADSWVGLSFGHGGFRMLEADEVTIFPDVVPLSEKTGQRDEATLLRFSHAILPLREYGAILHIRAESGRNRVQLRLPSAHVFAAGKLKSSATPLS
uniref:PilZ domain-containing protein n=1 Tax=Desulfacinum infernum TaxID=35837 RepID=A0A832EKP0_9BACT